MASPQVIYPHAEKQYRYSYNKICAYCHEPFTSWKANQQYCKDECRTAAQMERRRVAEPSHWLDIEIECPICHTRFKRTPEQSPNRKYCGDDCAYTAMRQKQNTFVTEIDPSAMAAWNRRRKENNGRDVLLNRLYRRYPDLPRNCEATENGVGCSEARVLEAAHRPEFKRNGAWRTMKWYERHMFWILCPTHHRLIDFNICTPIEIGLT